MILQALYRYYQILLKDPELEIAVPGYTTANVSFALKLSDSGGLLAILPFASKVYDGKKARKLPYRRMEVPEQVKRVNIAANFLCDNSTYVLGVSKKNDPKYNRQRFEEFRKFNIELLSKANSGTARAIIAFLKQHDPQTASQHPVIARHLEELLGGGNLIFWVRDKNSLEDSEIRRVWEEHQEGTGKVEMQCLVTGEMGPIARLHPSIKGVRDAQPTGASLVSFNERAYESYNRLKGQGLNAPVSQRVASGYGVALNYLLSNQNPNRKIFLGDTTVVYWAETEIENKRYARAIAALLDPEHEEQFASPQLERKDVEEQLHQVAIKIQRGQALSVDHLREGLDDNTRFYVLGLAPSAARLVVRFFFAEPFGKFVDHIMLHYEDLKIVKEYPDQPDYISVSRILSECISQKVARREEELKSSWSLLGGALMRSVLTGAPYPEGLYIAIINRIRHDVDENGGRRKINYIRAAFIKAHLLRKYRRQAQNPYQEALQMSLNESYTHPAYVLGRLFAVLEKAQREAVGDVNASIKDRYFTSACASPASVFPTLLRLAHHHTAKAEYGYATDYQIQQLLNLLEAKPFLPHLTLDEQGIFVLGYYHQRAAFYVKNGGKNTE